MDTSLEVDLDGCWQHHEIAENDKSDSDIILIDSIHSQYDTDTDVSDEERDADKFTSELSEVKIGKFDYHTWPTKLFICIDVIICMYLHIILQVRRRSSVRCLACNSANWTSTYTC